MPDAYIFLVDGFEEIEALAPLDILRRGGAKVETVSLTGAREVVGAQGVVVLADRLFDDTAAGTDAMFILPGGPGTASYRRHAAFLDRLQAHHAAGGRISAICAAPGVLGRLGLLAGKRACCYPGHEKELTGAYITPGPVETDGGLITGRSAGASLAFGLAVLAALKGRDAARAVKEKMVF